MTKGFEATTVYRKTKHGTIVLGDWLEYMGRSLEDASVGLIVTSPPFGLVQKKKYGNVDAHEYLEWFKPFGGEFRLILAPSSDAMHGPFSGAMN